VFQPTLGAELDNAFDQILRDLRTQYLIAYYPKDVPLNKDRFHQLQVSVRDPQLHVTARSGYYGEAEQSAGSSGPVGDTNDETMRPRKPVPANKPKGQ
jgi:Ca-activated chloride channel family protein